MNQTVISRILKSRADVLILVIIPAIVIAGHMISPVRLKAHPVMLLKTGESSMAYSQQGPLNATLRCVGALQSIGSNQLAYASFQGQGRYGTFDDLKDSLYIAPTYGLNSIAPGYSINWMLNKDESDFVVVAVPSDQMFLAPLMIDSRQSVLTLSPEEPENTGVDWSGAIDDEEHVLAAVGEYSWVVLPEEVDPARDFYLYLDEDFHTYCMFLKHAYIALNAQTLQPEPDYIYLSNTEMYYRTMPYE